MAMKFRKIVNIFAVITLTLGIFTGFVTPGDTLAGSSVNPSGLGNTLPVSETGLYVVQLVDPSVSAYLGGIKGLAATSPEATGARRLDANSPASQAYQAYLEAKQQSAIDEMQAAFGRSIATEYRYQYALNGFAAYLSHAEALAAMNLPGVLAVYADELHQMATDVSPELIGATSIWEGDTTGGLETLGEGIVVGMIDGGINHAHPSYAATGADGYTHQNPYGSGVYHGWCETNPGFCNDKLIGAYYLYPGTAESPEDGDGHGSHTSSTAAGNAHEAVFTVGTDTFTRSISGMAPHANIVAYKICNPYCPSSSAVEAVELAISEDLVDVINYSIGPGGNPWTDMVEVAFLDATAAGIFVSVSAGNSGPAAGTIEHSSPWTTSTAASTHSRIISNFMDVEVPGTELTDLLAIPGYGTTITAEVSDNIRWSGDVDPANIGACLPFPDESFNGVIGLAQRGGCDFLVKLNNLAAAGAVYAVIYNNVGGPPITMGFDPLPNIPGVMTTLEQGLAIAALIGGIPEAEVIIKVGAEVVIDPEWNDIMAGFSSRGPSEWELLKPDYAAPGVNVLAAVHAYDGNIATYDFYQGTSMASPHSAGSAALLMALHPDWTVSEIRSALASTANPTVMRDSDGVSPADPYDMGSGRLALYGAGNAGLVLDESYENYLAADPRDGGEPNALNLPYMVEFDCNAACSWTRTVKSVLPATQTWTVEYENAAGLVLDVQPATFTLDPGEEAALTITADVTGGDPLETLFGAVNLVPAAGVTTRFPVVVIVYAEPPTISVAPSSLLSTQEAEVATLPLTISNLGGVMLEWELYDDGLPVMAIQGEWADNFDSYLTDSELHGQGGWKGWGDDITYGATVTDNKAQSLPNSVAIVGQTDIVHEYADANTGFWTYTAWQLIPNNYTGASSFILLNAYDDLMTNVGWSVEVVFDGPSGTVYNNGKSGGSLPLVFGRFVELRVEIDLVNDEQSFYYDGDLLYSGSWSGEVSDAGALNLAAVDLFANDASAVYYDDMSLTMAIPEVCDLVGDVPWLSTNPTTGTTLPGESSLVSVEFDATGMDVGTYTATLCATSNDPVNPVVEIPVSMTVVEGVPTIPMYLPLIFKTATQ
jgi:hypothetical protein